MACVENVATGGDLVTIRWRLAVDENPDDGIVVLISAPAASEPIWLAFYDSEQRCWYSVDEYPLSTNPLHWAELPPGP